MREKRRPPCKRELFKRTLTTQKRKTFCDRRRGKRKTLSSFNSDQTLKKALRPPPPSLFPDTFRRNNPHRRKYGRGEREKEGGRFLLDPPLLFLASRRDETFSSCEKTQVSVFPGKEIFNYWPFPLSIPHIFPTVTSGNGTVFSGKK